jgi:Tub family
MRKKLKCICQLLSDFSALHGENDKLLMAARKVRRATGTDFVISLTRDDFSRNSNTYVGKLRYVLHALQRQLIVNASKTICLVLFGFVRT